MRPEKNFGLISLITPFVAISCKMDIDSQIKQETDDRLTSRTASLVDVTPVLEKMVNEGVEKARHELNIVSDSLSDEKRRLLIRKVGDQVGSYVKGSGVTPADIVQLTNLEMALDETLSEARNEKARIPFLESRYRKNPIGLPYVSGATPANISLKTANHTISSVFNFSGTLVGADKLAHIFAVGRKMFLANLEPDVAWKLSQFLEGHPSFPKGEKLKYAAIGASIDRAWGLFGVYGSFPTGIISEADMHANMHGIRFYKKLYDAPQTYRFTLNGLCVQEERPCQWYWNEQNVPNLFTAMIKVSD